MSRPQLRNWLGVGGVPAGDAGRAYLWERRLRWPMAFFAVLSIPAYYLEEVLPGALSHKVGALLEAVIFSAFAGELLWMLAVTHQRRAYLRRNWLDAAIVLSAALNMMGVATEWVALGRLLRLLLAGMMMARALGSLRLVAQPGGVLYLLAFGTGALLVGASGFYWLEPNVRNFGDALWLAFVTGSTVGYGDIVPSTTASRWLAVLMVVVGITILSVLTASISAFFIGEDEKALRRAMHEDLQRLRADVSRLIGEEELQMRRQLHAEVRSLRRDIEALRRHLPPPGGGAGR